MRDVLAPPRLDTITAGELAKARERLEIFTGLGMDSDLLTVASALAGVSRAVETVVLSQGVVEWIDLSSVEDTDSRTKPPIYGHNVVKYDIANARGTDNKLRFIAQSEGKYSGSYLSVEGNINERNRTILSSALPTASDLASIVCDDELPKGANIHATSLNKDGRVRFIRVHKVHP